MEPFGLYIRIERRMCMNSDKLYRVLFSLRAILILNLISIGGQLNLEGLTLWGRAIMVVSTLIFLVDAYSYWKMDDNSK